MGKRPLIEGDTKAGGFESYGLLEHDLGKEYSSEAKKSGVDLLDVRGMPMASSEGLKKVVVVERERHVRLASRRMIVSSSRLRAPTSVHTIGHLCGRHAHASASNKNRSMYTYRHANNHKGTDANGRLLEGRSAKRISTQNTGKTRRGANERRGRDMDSTASDGAKR